MRSSLRVRGLGERRREVSDAPLDEQRAQLAHGMAGHFRL